MGAMCEGGSSRLHTLEMPAYNWSARDTTRTGFGGAHEQLRKVPQGTILELSLTKVPGLVFGAKDDVASG